MSEQKTAVMIDSGCDLPPEIIRQYGIYMLPLHVMYPEKEYLDNVDIDPQMVYDRFPDEFPKTSTPSPAEVVDLFKRIRQDGYEKVIAICISSKFSGTFNTIRLMSQDEDEVEELGLEIFAFDTKNISVASGLLAVYAARLLQEGKSFEETREALEEKRGDCKVMFYMDTLTYLRKGGRIGKVASALGSALRLKPIISCDEEGAYYVESLIRGSKAGKKKLITEMTKWIGGHRCLIIVGHGEAPEEAKVVYDYLQATPAGHELLCIRQITATMAINTGPGLVGIAALRLD